MCATLIGKAEHTVPKARANSARIHMKDIKCVQVIKICEYRESGPGSCSGIAGSHDRRPVHH